jgi:hypothetical protein
VLERTPRTLRIGGREVPFTLRRSARRSIGLRLGQDGLTVSLPQRCPLTEVDRVLAQKSAWILDKLAELERRPAGMPLADGHEIHWLGEPRRIVLGGARSRIDGDVIQLVVRAGESPAAALTRLMRREARTFLGERLQHWAVRLDRHPSAFALSGARSRWGSCTASGAIRLNFRLMQAPLPTIDYVIIHELCHLSELNHSERFWALVAAACPDWKARRDWLKREGARYFAWS